MHEVRAPIAIEIDGILRVGIGRKLRLADFAGPAAARSRRAARMSLC